MAFAFRGEFRIDVSRCVGCRACEIACVTANDLTLTHSRNWVPYVASDGTAQAQVTFAPYLCMHCAEPPCVPACPTGASFQAADGRVLVNRDLCIGCAMCVPACPYDARYVDPQSNKLEKCTLCEGRVKGGLAPACFDVCPANARLFRETNAAGVVVAVGDPAALDPGHAAIHLTAPDVDPKPRLVLSGRPEDLRLVQEKRAPRFRVALVPSLWRNGAGIAVQGLGVLSALAMAGMVGLRALRARRAKVAAVASAPPAAVAPGDSSGEE